MEKYIKNNLGYFIHLISSLLFCCILNSRNFNPTFTSRLQCWTFSVTFTLVLSVLPLSLRGGPPRAWVVDDPSAKILRLLFSASLHPPSPTAAPWMSLKTPWFSPPFIPMGLSWLFEFFPIFSVLYFKHSPKLISCFFIAPIPPLSIPGGDLLDWR